MAVKYYSLAAAQNHARAQDKLGVCLQLGQGIAQDVRLAVRYFRLAAEQGHLAGQYHLANALVSLHFIHAFLQSFLYYL